MDLSCMVAVVISLANNTYKYFDQCYVMADMILFFV